MALEDGCAKLTLDNDRLIGTQGSKGYRGIVLRLRQTEGGKMVVNSNTKSVQTHLKFICKNTAGECVEESKCFVDDDRPARDAGHEKVLLPPPTGYTPNANVESLSRTFESYFSYSARRMRVNLRRRKGLKNSCISKLPKVRRRYVRTFVR